jgi:hypothetical protein
MKNKIVMFIGCQRFKCIGKRRSVTKDGRKIQLLIMESYCPDCGNRFENTITKKSLIRTGSINRRCDDCKQVGVKIPATRRRIFGIS